MVIAFTGHRYDKLGGYCWKSAKNRKIINALHQLIMHNRADRYICGGALGIDMIAFEICYDEKSSLECKLEVAIPLREQPKYYREMDKELYTMQLMRANTVTYVDELSEYASENINAKMQKRNEYMVDNADMVIAVWDGSKGGTKNCIDYALSQYKKVVALNPNTLTTEVLENKQIRLF